MPSMVVVQHVLAEGLGRIEPLLRNRNIDIEIIRTDTEFDMSAVKKASGLIILGRPMSVYEADRYPRLRTEMRLIEAALKRPLPILGLRLGSQLLTAVLGQTRSLSLVLVRMSVALRLATMVCMPFGSNAIL
jgi:GMP synthase (glutamine-hydrolysing)